MGFILLTSQQMSMPFSWMLTECWRFLGQRQKSQVNQDLIAFSLAGMKHELHVYSSSSCAQIPWGQCRAASWVLHTWWACAQPRNSELRKTSSLLRSSQQTCPIFAPEGDITSWLGNKPALCLGGRHSPAFQDCYTDILDKIVNKAVKPHRKTHRNARDPWEIIFQH